ncbi:MAG: hypothetical protein R3279_10925, partial [Putridiphycobacter sp.]|nr:hypothetical protein [Putridiphycobacter sp.]
PSVIGQDGDNIYVVRYESSKKPLISAYKTNNLRSTKSAPLIIEYKGKKLDFIEGYIINNQPILATKFYNKKGKVVYFFAHKVDENLKVGPPILVGSVPFFGGGISFSYSSRGNTVSTEDIFNVSADGQNVFGLFNQSSKGSPSKDYKSVLLDQNLDKIADATVSLPYLPENFVTLKQELGNDGRLYILGYNTIKGKSSGIIKREEIFRDHIWLYAVDTENGEIEKVEIETSVDVEQMSLKVSENGNIFIGALTSTAESGMNGSMCIIYDNALNELNRTITPFESDFIKTTYTEKQLKKQEKKERKANSKGKAAPTTSFYNYDMRHIVESKDGSFTVFAEQYYVIVTSTTTTNSNGTTTTSYTYHYYYNDIIAVRYNRDGQYIWKNVIEKRQHSINDFGFYSSFFPIVDGNDIGVIFNTKEIENLDEDELSRSEKKAASRKTICMNVTLTNDGGIDKEELFSFDEGEKLQIAPKYSSQTASGDVVIFAKSRKGSKIGVIQL